jgi:hypothetical protein
VFYSPVNPGRFSPQFDAKLAVARFDPGLEPGAAAIEFVGECFPARGDLLFQLLGQGVDPGKDRVDTSGHVVLTLRSDRILDAGGPGDHRARASALTLTQVNGVLCITGHANRSAQTCHALIRKTDRFVVAGQLELAFFHAVPPGRLPTHGVICQRGLQLRS